MSTESKKLIVRNRRFYFLSFYSFGNVKRDQVLETVRLHHEKLEQLGVKSLELFGSVARDQATSNSDADFLVEFSTEAGLFELFRVQHFLEDILGCSVDLGTKDSLREHSREPIVEDLIRVF